MILLVLLSVAACSDDKGDSKGSGQDADVTAPDARGTDSVSTGTDATEQDATAPGEDVRSADGGSVPGPGSTDVSGPGSSDATGGGDSDSGQPGEADAGEASDSGPNSPDATTGEADSGLPSVDAGEGGDATTDEDTTPGEDPWAGRPTGQCVRDSDCPAGPMGPGECFLGLPGGRCNASCGDDAHCPSVASCNDYGACAGDCSVDNDCAPGLRCTQQGCAAVACVNGQCPIPYLGCDTSLSRPQCARIKCSSDPSVCPGGTTCMSGYCVENRAL